MTKEKSFAEIRRYYEEGRSAIEQDSRWAVTFNELCEDGAVRPVALHPHKISNIKRPESPLNPSNGKWIDYEFFGCVVTQDGREILLYENLWQVLSALGAMSTAAWAEFQQKINTSSQLEQDGVDYRRDDPSAVNFRRDDLYKKPQPEIR